MGLLKSKALLPTEENLLSTLKEDLIDRNEELCYFVSLLNQIDENCSIGIDGQWGSGKTFFVKHTKMILDSYNKFSSVYADSQADEIKKTITSVLGNNLNEDSMQLHISVYYDAWLNDNTTDPALSLVYSIIKTMPDDYKDFLKKTSYKADSMIKSIRTVTDMFAPEKIKIPASFVLEFAENFLKATQKDDLLHPIRNQESIQMSISNFLDCLLEERGNRLVIFIDELDRCKPSFAVQLLEQIKHYFTNERITFVFSINSKELQHAIKQVYGNDFDACRYLDRFFDYRISLPPANIEKYCQEFVSSDIFYSDYLFSLVYKAIIQKYELSLREIERFSRMSRIAIQKIICDGSKYKSARWFCESTMVPLMIVLSMTNSNALNDFVNGRGAQFYVEILDNDEIGYIVRGHLLNWGERYDDEDIGGKETDKAVSYRDKLVEIYNAIWDPTPSRSIEGDITIGEYTFRKDSKKVLLKAASILSAEADYEADE